MKRLRLWAWLKGPKRLWLKPCGPECGATFPDGSPDTLHTATLTRLSSWALR